MWEGTTECLMKWARGEPSEVWALQERHLDPRTMVQLSVLEIVSSNDTWCMLKVVEQFKGKILNKVQ